MIGFTSASDTIRKRLQAGEGLLQFDVCYLKNDGKYYQADADSATTMPVFVMAAEAISLDAYGAFYMPKSVITNSAWTWTTGKLLFASTTAGGVVDIDSAPSGSGDQVQVIGIAMSATQIYFDPNMAIVEIT